VTPRLSDLLLSSQSDERLVSLARAGHERAFVAIVERYRPELQALARRLCSDGRAEDVVQQAFLSAFAALRAGAEVRHLRGWLYQIVRNATKRSQPPVHVPLDGAGTCCTHTLEEVVQQRALAMSVLAELARLPQRQRQAMIGTALHDPARAAIASSWGLSEGAVRQLVHRARSALRTAVTAVTPWPVARWLVAVRPAAPGTAELASTAGAASSGGLAIKLGALLASGTLVTGVAAVDLRGPARHGRGDHGAARAQRASLAGPRSRPLVLAAVTPPASPYAELTAPSPAGTAGNASPVAAGAPRHLRTDRRQPGRAGSEPRSGGRRVEGRDGPEHAAQGEGGANPAGRHTDDGGSALRGSGSDGRGQDGGPNAGRRSDGGSSDGGSSDSGSSDGGSGDGGPTGGQRSDGGDGGHGDAQGSALGTGTEHADNGQTLSNSTPLSSAADGHGDTGSASGSGSGSGSTVTFSSDAVSGSDTAASSDSSSGSSSTSGSGSASGSTDGSGDGGTDGGSTSGH
jgi:RNA polymerase sigma factor (sigma-70 family)